MTRQYTQWTYPELVRIAARRKAGEPWKAIEADYDVNANAIRKTLQRYGLGLNVRKRGQVREDEAVILRAISLRNQQWTWTDIAHAVEWRKTWQALRKACHSSAKRNRQTVWTGRGEP